MGILRRIVPLVFAAICGVLAVVWVRQYLKQKYAELDQARAEIMKQYQQPIEVVVAAKDIPAETPLEASLLKIAVVPEKWVQPYAVRAQSQSELLGKVTVAPLAENEQLLANKVRRAEEAPVGSTLSSLTPKGKRAVTITVDTLTGVGGFVRPGDKVDLLWNIQLPGADKSSQVVTLTLFQDVPVLAVGRELVGKTASAASSDGKDYTVTIALSPQETSFLLFAREQGRIQLSLRPRQGEPSQVAVTPANINTLLGTLPGFQTPGQPPPVRKAEIYKGLKRDVVVLSDE